VHISLPSCCCELCADLVVILVHAHRQEKSLPALQTFTIDVISSDHPNLDHEDQEMLKATKISSTFIREWIVKNQGGPQGGGRSIGRAR
jgi:hypothetical protein